jgi:hypothetical protein
MLPQSIGGWMSRRGEQATASSITREQLEAAAASAPQHRLCDQDSTQTPPDTIRELTLGAQYVAERINELLDDDQTAWDADLVIGQAGVWAREQPAAISGQGGHSQTFSKARKGNRNKA